MTSDNAPSPAETGEASKAIAEVAVEIDEMASRTVNPRALIREIIERRLGHLISASPSQKELAAGGDDKSELLLRLNLSIKANEDLTDERDTALARLAQSDALLREAAETLLLDPDLCNDEHTYLSNRITAHLATATTKEGK